MQILYVIDSLTVGGAERLILDFAKNLSKEHKIGVYVLKRVDSYIQEQVLNMEGISFYCYESLLSPLHIIRIVRIAKNYDVVHVNLFPALYWAAIAKCFLRNKRFVYTEHSTFNKRRKYPILQKVEKWIYGQYDYIVAISNKVRESLLVWIGNNKRNIVTINNGVDIRKFTTAKAVTKSMLGIDDGHVMIFMSARFSAAKDQSTVVKSFPFLLNNRKIHIVFAGDGPLLENVKLLAEQMGISANIHFLGFRNDIPEIIKASDICVLSSKWEGFGLVAVEYMAAGKPVIASNVDGLNDVVRGAGMLFEQGNEKELAEKINLLIADDSLYNQMSKNCMKRSELYDLSHMISSYLSLYKS